MKECKFSLKVRKYITLLASLLLVFFTSELLSQAVLYKLIDGKKIKSDQNVLASDKTFNKDTYVINNINPSQDDDRLLIFESAQVDKLYLFINGNLADTLKYGNIVPSAARRFRDRNIILPLKWIKNDQDIIIKVTNNANYSIPFFIRSSEDHRQREIVFYAFIGLYTGITFLFIFIQLMAIFRYKVFNYNFYYLFYLLFTYLYFMSEFGVLRLNIVESYTPMEETLTFLLISGSCFFLLLFVKEFIQKNIPFYISQSIKLLLGFIIVNVFLTITQLFRNPTIYPYVFYSMLVIVVLSFLSAWISSACGSLRKVKFSSYLTASFTFLAFGACLKPMSISSIIGSSFITSYGGVIGHLIEIIILSTILINEGINRVKLSQKLKAENIILEKTALASQINPHFIFNCLNAIQSFIMTNDKESANNYLIKFSRLIRLALDASIVQSISLHSEKEFLMNYLSLEQLRHDSKFSFEIIIPSHLDVNNIHIPPMLIQPFAENAIKHGFRSPVNHCHLKIEFLSTQYNDVVLVKVVDNGIGIGNTNPLSNKYKPVGSSLTRKRLQLINNSLENHVTYKTLNPATDGQTGTEVIITIKTLGLKQTAPGITSEADKDYKIR